MPIVERDALADVRHHFEPERSGPVIFGHVVASGHGRVEVDRWPDPQVLCAELPGNIALRGDPAAPGAASIVDLLAGFVEAPPEWMPVLTAGDPDLGLWNRTVATLADTVVVDGGDRAVRLGRTHLAALKALPEDISWIASTWGGPAGLAAADVAHGIYVDGVLASVAVPFFVGRLFEDIGVVTRSEHRQRGLSAECTRALVSDIRARGHVPTWTTSPDNIGSLAVADRLGFEVDRTDVLYALRTPIPT